MRRAVAFSLLLALVGCSGEDLKQSQPTTPPPVATSSTTALVPSTTTPSATSTTSATAADDDPGTESIGITEKITITITDPED